MHSNARNHVGLKPYIAISVRQEIINQTVTLSVDVVVH